ncbi:MAG: hypothetical protein DRJ03_24300 [Chloroflexi bacterium]|nr:MAG: hypothetical protein DRJ03_24300 [Chloroflexota bacterium]
MTETSFDTLFNSISDGDPSTLLHKGHARNALRYAGFDLTDIDQTELATRIIQTAITTAKKASTESKERLAFSVALDSKKVEKSSFSCPRCNSASPMQNTELLGNVKARYCPHCRLTEIA